MIAEATESPLACSVCGHNNESVRVDTRRQSSTGTYTTALDVHPVRFLAGGMFHVCKDCQEGTKSQRIRMPKASFTNAQADRVAAKYGVTVSITHEDGTVEEKELNPPTKAKTEAKMYAEYVNTMNSHGIEPRPLDVWLSTFRATKAR